ncbi:signal peptidase I [Microbulbifer sp. YPW16]|uniref:signal peptidase I n=1 Tax=Microbulbifer sp. YPW16 TaxID=2904242 RepID=UPI0021065B54|nr:signal peptidase I [Microbulbifer sp. YPW16]
MALMLIFRSALADWNHVPTGSMRPTIQVGDYILVDKMAYDLRVPFTHHSLVRFAGPARGDIVVFDSAVTGNRLVKRVIGVPGDTVALQGNRLAINGHPVQYLHKSGSRTSQQLVEMLPGQDHPIRLLNSSHSPGFAAVSVPAGFYLVLGDNRDNSADSRVIGLVPRNEIVGRAHRVLLSLDYDNFHLPRRERFLKPI